MHEHDRHRILAISYFPILYLSHPLIQAYGSPRCCTKYRLEHLHLQTFLARQAQAQPLPLPTLSFLPTRSLACETNCLQQFGSRVCCNSIVPATQLHSNSMRSQSHTTTRTHTCGMPSTDSILQFYTFVFVNIPFTTNISLIFREHRPLLLPALQPVATSTSQSYLPE